LEKVCDVVRRVRDGRRAPGQLLENLGGAQCLQVFQLNLLDARDDPASQAMSQRFDDFDAQVIGATGA